MSEKVVGLMGVCIYSCDVERSLQSQSSYNIIRSKLILSSDNNIHTFRNNHVDYVDKIIIYTHSETIMLIMSIK